MITRSAFLRGAGLAGLAALAAPTVLPTAAPSGFRKFGTYAHGTDLPATAGPVVRGGVIRFTPTGPELHVNGAHQSYGIDPRSIKINAAGNLEFRLDGTLPVMTAQVSPDETLVERDIEGGLSGGASLCIVTFTHKGRKLNLRWPSHYNLIAGPVSNVWIGVTSYHDGR